jgi:hypothetical protein
MFANVCAIISLAYITVAVIQTAISLSTKDKRKRCTRIQNYKKGKFAAMYVAAFPLYLAAYQAKPLLWMVVDSFNAMLKIAVLSFDMTSLNAIGNTNTLFHIAVIACVVLTMANTTLLSISVFFRRVYNFIMLRRIKSGKRDVIVLVGFGKKNRSVLLSMKREKENIPELARDAVDVLVLAEGITPEMKEEIYISSAAYASLGADLGKLLESNCGHFDKRHVRVIIETEDAEHNLKRAYQVATLASSLGEDAASAYSDLRTGLDTYVFSDEERDSLYRRIIRRSRGTVHPANLFKMIASDFIDTYPLTALIGDRIDTERALVKDGTEVRVILMGFGKVNRRIFYLLVQNNRLLAEHTDPKTGERYIGEADIKYYVFDKNDAEHDSEYNHNYARYSRWLEEKRDTSSYFELPKEPAEPIFEKIDSNDRSYFSRVKSALSGKASARNVIIVSVGDDLEALDISEKLTEAVREAGCDANTSLFVRIKSESLAREASVRYEGEIPFVPFGQNSKFYTYDRIVNPSVESMARDRHLCYTLEEPRTGESTEDTRRRAIRQWLFEWEEVQRESNVYACLSLRTRFNLLGFDIKRGDARIHGDDSDAFLAAYAVDNRIKYKDETVNGKRLVDYGDRSYRVSGSVRERLAIMEHLRWNAYYISAGFVPASRDEHVEIPKASRMRRRIHINLTTDTGLCEYERWCESELGYSPTDADILKYDYQLMDDAVWLLHRSGYMIVRIKNDEECEK